MARVAFWNFLESSGSSTAVDSELGDGTAQNGIFQNGATTNDAGSGVFDGVNDYVEVPTDPAFSLTQGSIVITFTQDTTSPGDRPFGGSAAHTLFSRDSSGFDGGGHLTIFIRNDGSVGVRHQTTNSNFDFTSIGGTDQSGQPLPDVGVTLGQETTIIYSWGPDGSELIVDGTVVDAVPDQLTLAGNNEPIVIGASQAQSGNNVANSVNGFFDGTIQGVAIFDESVPDDTVPCFTLGTMILTPSGDVPIETLKVGDLVSTLDNGPQPIRWIGQRHVSDFALSARPNLRPIRIRAGAIGNQTDLLLSPQHRILLSGWQAELWFGAEEVLTSAKSLVNDDTIQPDTCAEVTYLHLMFDAHEVVFANGVPSESFFPGPCGLEAVGREARDEIAILFPELTTKIGTANGQAARMCLKRNEGAMIAQHMA